MRKSFVFLFLLYQFSSSQAVEGAASQKVCAIDPNHKDVATTSAPLPDFRVPTNGELQFLFDRLQNKPATTLSQYPDLEPVANEMIEGSILGTVPKTFHDLSKEAQTRLRETWIRHTFVQEKANPNLLQVYGPDGLPLEIYILETIHPLPRAVLPEHVMSRLICIAATHGSQLLSEVNGDFWRESREERIAAKRERKKAFLENLALRIDIEEQVAKEIRLCRDYASRSPSPFFTEEQFKKNAEDLRKIYDQGWSKFLSDKSRKFLFKTFSEDLLNKINPYILARVIKRMKKHGMGDGENSHPLIKFTQLDAEVSELFQDHSRKALDSHEIRGQATYLGGLVSSEFDFGTSYSSTSFTPCKEIDSLLEDIVAKAGEAEEEDESNESDSDSHVAVSATVYAHTKQQSLQKKPTLRGVDFLDPIYAPYLMGAYSDGKGGEELDYRNTTWWEADIAPLLKQHLETEGLPPSLIMYGQGHSIQGETGILRRMVGEGCRLFKVQRNNGREEVTDFYKSLLTSK
ncbi:hypothetical protein OAN22_02255 [Alphaproteobacteria bacterium]|nr:hypothetical protein [Alphaproteobacteria bacterium]